VARLHNNPRPLRTIKDAAYAWRQALFFLSLTTQDEQDQFTAWAGQELARQPGHVAHRLTPVLAGLRHATARAAWMRALPPTAPSGSSAGALAGTG
jgi:hypothetical protein